MTDIDKIRNRAETAYRAVCRLAEETAEYAEEVRDSLEGMRQTRELAHYAEQTATERYIKLALDAEEEIRAYKHCFDIHAPDIASDPYVSEAYNTMMFELPPGEEA